MYYVVKAQKNHSKPHIYRKNCTKHKTQLSTSHTARQSIQINYYWSLFSDLRTVKMRFASSNEFNWFTLTNIIYFKCSIINTFCQQIKLVLTQKLWHHLLSASPFPEQPAEGLHARWSTQGERTQLICRATGRRLGTTAQRPGGAPSLLRTEFIHTQEK